MLWKLITCFLIEIRITLKPPEIGQSVISLRFQEDDNDYYVVGKERCGHLKA